MNSLNVALRPLVVDDTNHIEWCLYTAIAWSPEREQLPWDLVLGHPQVVIFRNGWGRLGDFGILATVDGQRAGVAFARLFTDDEQGEGFVDEKTPELAVAVDRQLRGRGIGRILLDAMAEEGRARGFEALSLSVDSDNPAVRLYERAGYQILSNEDGDTLMLLRL